MNNPFQNIKINHHYKRREDMSPDGMLTIIFQPDGDVIVVIDDEHGQTAQVEFCELAAGGGRSSHTRKALAELALAIEKDNKERPIVQWI